MIIFGHKSGTEAVPGGRSDTRGCEVCGKRTEFHEARVRKAATLYFTPVANFESTLIMRCSVCGNGYPIEDRSNFVERQQGTLAGWIAGGASTAVDAIAAAIPEGALDTEGLEKSASSLLAEGRAWFDQSTGGSEWQSLMTRFENLLPDDVLRDRIWQRKRPAYPGPVHPLETIDTASTHDVDCLRQILEDYG